MRVGVDIDGVTADFAATANDWLWKQTGEWHPTNQWDWFKQYTDGENLWRKFWQTEAASEVFSTCNPVPGAIRSIQLLDELGHEVIFITQRNEKYAAETGYWLLNNHVDFPVAFVKDKTSVFCDILIDDKPENVQALRAIGRRAVLFGQPWNTDADLPRALGWLHVLKVLP